MARHGAILDLVLVLLLVLVLALDPRVRGDIAGHGSAVEQVYGQDRILERRDRADHLVTVLRPVVVGVAIVGQVGAGVLVVVVEAVVVSVLATVPDPVVVAVHVPRVGSLLELVSVVDLVAVLVLVRLIDPDREMEPLLPAIGNAVAVSVLRCRRGAAHGQHGQRGDRPCDQSCLSHLSSSTNACVERTSYRVEDHAPGRIARWLSARPGGAAAHAPIDLEQLAAVSAGPRSSARDPGTGVIARSRAGR